MTRPHGKLSPRWWTSSEDAVLRELYPAGGSAAVREKLSSRSPSAIRERAIHLGVARALPPPESPERQVAWWGSRVDRARARELFWSKVRKTDGCWLWLGSTDKDGYGKFQISVPGQNRQVTIRAHRFAWEDEHGPVPAGALFQHDCDMPGCVRTGDGHAHPGTQSANLQDCVARRRHPHTKLMPDEVRAIRSRLAAGEEATSIARDLKRPVATIYGIKHGRTWGWLP